jgi:hypothetical protein
VYYYAQHFGHQERIQEGLNHCSRKLKSAGVKRLMEDALWTQGLRKKLETEAADHGFRKWFKM